MQPWTQEVGRSSSHWYPRTAMQIWSPSIVYLPRPPPHLRACDQWHPSHLAYPARRLPGYAQRLLVLNIPTTTRRRMCLRLSVRVSLRPLQILPPIPVEPRRRHMTLGDYTRKLSLYGVRCSDFVQRDWYLRHRRAIRRGVDSILVLNSLHMVLRGVIAIVI
jgi:hypothetical protein